MEQELEKVENVEETTQQVEETKFMSEGDDSVIKIDLSKPPQEKTEKENATTEQSTDEVPVRDESKVSEEVREENVEAEVKEPTGEEERVQNEEAPVVEEVTEEVEEQVEELAEEVEEAVAEAEATGKPLPENIQKLVDFMEDTGGSLEDYVRLNQDYSGMDNLTVLQEYYKLTKPHLDAEERAFLMDETFSYDEEADDEKDIRKKKIALKEQVAEAKAYLDGQKSKYYEDIKAGSKLTTEQQKAIDFFNRYNKESEETEKASKTAKSYFIKETDKVFNNKFKGFEYNVGDKKYRFNVKNVDAVKQEQSSIDNFVKKFLTEDNKVADAKEYHKSIFTANNADAIARHFYEQGKADAMKDSIAKSKNVDMTPRQTHGEIETGGVKYRVLSDSDSKFGFKKRK
tara:strand:+ start:1054 stop:2256 length:1203 start_codon:yes stop_codon:yes gene_type:complete